MKAIHGSYGGIEKTLTYSKSSSWLDLINSILHLLSKGVNLFSIFQKRFDNGSEMSFWKDVWVGDRPFMYRFHRLLR